MTTLIYGDTTGEVPAALPGAGQLWLDGAALQAATGWEIKPEGICRDEVCIRVNDRPELLRQDASGTALDLAGFARLIGQPFAHEDAGDVWSFAPSVEQRRSALMELQAPDFTLPDLDSNLHSLSEQRGKKVVLALWASW